MIWCVYERFRLQKYKIVEYNRQNIEKFAKLSLQNIIKFAKWSL